MPDGLTQNQSHKARYEQLSQKRGQFLERARHNALLTHPSAMPLSEEGHQAQLYEPYQTLGADGVSHMASRLLMSLMPAGRPHTRLDVDPQVLLQRPDGTKTQDEERGLSFSEKLIQSEVESVGWRDATLEGLEQLIIAGNVLEWLRPDNTIRNYRLDQYVVMRDHSGTPVDIVIKEKFLKITLDEDLRAAVEGKKDDEEIELYTRIRRMRDGNKNVYVRTQEIDEGIAVSGSTEWDPEDMPYFAHRWVKIPGEDYGRAKVTQHAGDLRGFEKISQALVESGAMSSRNLILVAPSAAATGLKNRIARAANGAVLTGRDDDVAMKSFENVSGFQILERSAQMYAERISRGFLLQSVGQRDAERVTAREIARDARELEAALGGVFSTLSTEMMERRTRLAIANMQQAARLPDWPKGIVRPIILTGLEALSREVDVDRAFQAAELAAAFGEEGLDAVKKDVVLARAYHGLGITDAVRTEQEMLEVRQARSQQQMLEKGLAGAIPRVAQEAAKQETE